MFHSTHRFFLTSSAIYVVVYNMADEQTHARLQYPKYLVFCYRKTVKYWAKKVFCPVFSGPTVFEAKGVVSKIFFLDGGLYHIAFRPLSPISPLDFNLKIL